MADIIHVITDLGVGGAGILLSHLFDGAHKENGSLVVLPRGSLLISLFLEKGIPHLTYDAEEERSFCISDARAVGRILEEKRPSLVVSHASLSARLAAKRLRIPTVSVRHCDTSVRPLSVFLYNALTDATVATSLPLCERLHAAGIKNVVTIENGYTDMGVPDEKERALARERFGFSGEGVVIGLSGRLAPVKGHETALRALSLLGDTRHRFTLCFLGRGEEEGRLRALSLSLGIQEQVRFLGFSPDARPFYHAIDAHISCSLDSETSSLSLAEGLSAGCPTLASDTRGNLARIGEGGRFFPRGDASALAALFSSLLDEEERARLSRLALARARALPTWEKMRKGYDAFFGTFRDKLMAKGCFLEKDMLQ